jgi:hypothetical protein
METNTEDFFAMIVIYITRTMITTLWQEITRLRPVENKYTDFKLKHSQCNVMHLTITSSSMVQDIMLSVTQPLKNIMLYL